MNNEMRDLNVGDKVYCNRLCRYGSVVFKFVDDCETIFLLEKDDIYKIYVDFPGSGVELPVRYTEDGRMEPSFPPSLISMKKYQKVVRKKVTNKQTLNSNPLFGAWS